MEVLSFLFSENSKDYFQKIMQASDARCIYGNFCVCTWNQKSSCFCWIKKSWRVLIWLLNWWDCCYHGSNGTGNLPFRLLSWVNQLWNHRRGHPFLMVKVSPDLGLTNVHALESFLYAAHPAEKSQESQMLSLSVRLWTLVKMTKDFTFLDFIINWMKRWVLGMREEWLSVTLTKKGFSGGEKKRNEILQLLSCWNPKFALLDEIDVLISMPSKDTKRVNAMRGESFGAMVSLTTNVSWTTSHSDVTRDDGR